MNLPWTLDEFEIANEAVDVNLVLTLSPSGEVDAWVLLSIIRYDEAGEELDGEHSHLAADDETFSKRVWERLWAEDVFIRQRADERNGEPYEWRGVY